MADITKMSDKEILMELGIDPSDKKKDETSNLTDEDILNQLTVVAPEVPKKSGVIKNVLSSSAKGLARAEERVLERGKLDFVKSIQKLGDEKLTERVIGGLEVVADPLRRMEAVVSNPLLEAQKGDYLNIPASVVEAVKGQRVGEFGDVYIAAGVPEKLANGLGLATDIVLGGAIIEQGIKGLQKGLVKGIDKLGIKGVENLLKGVDRAQDATKKLTNDFWKTIDDVKVDANDFLEEVTKLPKKVVEFLEDEAGKRIEDIVSSGTLKDLRRIKQLLAKLRSGTFTGIETLSKETIKKSYATTAKLIDKTLIKNGLAKKVPELKRINSAAEEIITAAEIVKKSVQKGSGELKVTEAMKKFEKFKGADFKRNLNRLKQQSSQASKMINRGTITLKRLLQKEARGKIISGLLRAGLYGGIAGSIGSRALRDATD